MTAKNAGRTVSRRDALAAGAAAIAGVAASLALPSTALAADGDSILIGQANAGSEPTELSASVAGQPAMSVLNPDSGGIALGTHGFVGMEARLLPPAGGGLHRRRRVRSRRVLRLGSPCRPNR